MHFMSFIFKIIIVFQLFSIPEIFAVTSWEPEQNQTANFITALVWFFSIDLLLKIIFTIIVVILTLIISKLIKNKLFWYLERADIGDENSKEEIIGVISRTVNIFILISWFSIALWVLGVDLGIFMWGIWFGIGFTLRTFLTNFISGIIIVSQWSYHIGDLIQVEDKMGRITKINTLFTAIEEFDGVTFNIPNVKFFEENVRNYHTNDKRRLNVEVVVDYTTDIVTTKKVLMKVVSNFPQILQAPEPDIIIDELWEKGVSLKLRFWVQSTENFITLRSNITETINLAFSQTGIQVSYPKRFIVWENKI